MATNQAGIILQHVRKILNAQETDQLSDRELLRRFAQERDEAAFATLVRRHGPMILHGCQRVLHNWHDAEDTFQATFLVLARNAASRRWDESVGTWLYLVAYRLALKVKASCDRRAQLATRPVERTSEDPLGEVSGRELCGVLDEELSRLPERCRAPLVLCYLEGLTRDEAARQLGWSLGTFRRRLEQGRALLRQRLVRRGLPLSAVLAWVLGTTGVTPAALPLGLAHSAVQMAMRTVLRKTVPAALVCTRAAVLAEGVLKGMYVAKLKAVLVIVLVVWLAGAGAGLVLQRAPAMKPAEEQQPETLRPATQEAGKPPGLGQPQVVLDLYGDPLPEGAIHRLGTMRLRHGSVVSGIAVSPDGKTLASASWDQSVRLWDMATGKELLQFRGHQGRVSSIAFSPTGKLVASGGENLRVWDVTTGKELYRSPVVRGGIESVAFSPDGQTIAYTHPDQTIRFLEAATGNEALQLAGHQGMVHAVAFSPDGKLLASAGTDQTVRLWEAGTGREIVRLKGHQDRVLSVAFSGDGKTLASGGRDRTIRLWEVGSGQELRRLPGHQGTVRSLAFSPDGSTLASGTGPFETDRTIRLWEIASGKEIRRFRGGMLTSVAFTPDGKTLVAAEGDPLIHLWDLATGKGRGPLEGKRLDGQMPTFSPDGKLLATGGWPNVRLWDAATGEPLRELVGHANGVWALAFSPDATTLACGERDGAIRLWDVATGREKGRLQGHQSEIVSLAFSPDGKLLADASRGQTILLWDVAKGQQLRQLTAHQEAVLSVAFSPDGKRLASAGRNGTISLWETATGHELRRFPGHQGGVQGVAYSPDGRLLASVGWDGTLRLWHAATGKELYQMKEPPSWASRLNYFGGGMTKTLAFSPDGKTLATGSWQTVLLWEVSTGKERGRFEGHGGEAVAVSFSPDGRRLVSGSIDTTALVWDVTSLGGRLRAANPSPQELETLWLDLADEDAAKAYRAILGLAGSAKQAVPLLAKRLPPAAHVADEQRTARLIADLESDAFAVRQKASAELVKLGGIIEPALRQALEGNPTLETRLRLERLLEKMDRPPLIPEQVRVLRALEALERAGSPEARQLLGKLSGGAPGARLTQEAKEALERLGQWRTTAP